MRADLLKHTGYPNHKEIYDIKAQIPRMTYILQGGGYGDVKDFYEIEGISRDMAKMMALPSYFDRTLGLGQWHSLRTFINDKKNKFPKWKDIDTKGEQYNEMKALWYGAFETCWNHLRGLLAPIGSEIFLWTSVWEQLIIWEAREKLGITLLNVYDGFYCDDINAKEDIEKTARETSLKVRELYMEGAKHR